MSAVVQVTSIIARVTGFGIMTVRLKTRMRLSVFLPFSICYIVYQRATNISFAEFTTLENK